MIALCIFVVDYGLLFWAEQRVPSGIAAVMLATIPVFMTLSEIIFLRTQRLTVRLALALLVGIGGVLILVSHSVGLSEKPIDPAGAVALVIAAMSWSVASTLTRKLSLPESKVMSSGAQMLAGGIMLTVAAGALGMPFRGFLAAMSIARAIRFFAEGYLAVRYGAQATRFLVEHSVAFAISTVAFVLVFYWIARVAMRGAPGQKA